MLDMRPHLVLALLPLLLLAGCKALRLDGSNRTHPSDWLTEGDSPLRQHRLDVPLDPPLEQGWVYNAASAFGPGSPLLLGEAVVVAGRNGEVHAIHAQTGKRLGMQDFGEAVEGTPVIDAGRLYLPLAWGKKTLLAYDLAAAREVWAVRGAPLEAGLLLVAQTLVSVEVEGVVRAYDARTGAETWQYALGERASAQATPLAVGEGQVVVVDDDGHLVALQVADGRLLWQQALEMPVYAAPASDGTRIFIPTTRGRLFAVDARDGAVRWVYRTGDPLVRLTTPALDGADLAVGGSDGVLRLLDARTGQERWRFTDDSALTAAPLLTPHTVYFGTMRRDLVALARTSGAEQWRTTLRGRVKSALAAREGQLVVLSEPHFVYLFKPVATANATP
jgi:outer membrane protein assembly factor BamB